jgi:hypothetical protein
MEIAIREKRRVSDTDTNSVRNSGGAGVAS